ncbi:PREDICTED: death-associated inhibitor of apoptosis 1 [Rhagoletis zephyria]|uniref:death-associated inhibitor of apoptosis 1 n=1 Tax=Rhagoletis zephyria TaxID=28612 RepID=UPI0008114EAD|nr:PREDICTED: death-associated inhibitor of apoptosis 1 [Rhagoletis zephyria]XP_017474498.1 PREDICTED: death-associated inhibitor of apoptosis 1 [Rhagoletis zephyria]XP_017474507.1 PREDICTED: death-associated inhibitor of apoptosis 1 [Rhagoletis zephyria]XP_017474515.1 PREDICTED: death-associated inhibitor of apoptosis 1 [Rhagoletis zephyria]XP_017474519.1 PREDICTED: death-associated inhibitor of apoptosis 1 [Rhagoletis zephyria]
MSETITEKPSTYKANNSNHHCLRSYFCPTFFYTNSYDVTDNKTNEMFHHQWKPEQFTMDEKYQREDERLKTFENWPLEWLNKKELAQTGLFYTGEDDKVKCYFCEVEIGRWEREDQPVNEHLRFSPNCPLLRRRTTNNVPLNGETLNRVLPPISYDVCGNEGLELENEAAEPSVGAGAEEGLTTTAPVGVTYQYDSIASGHATHNNSNVSNNNSSSSSRCGNELQLYRPEYPEYAIEAARLRSFAEWPRNMKQRPKQLADAGFFYTGIGDRVKCFSCGCGLKDWDDDDEPWEQHALWLPKCRYLNLLKGQSFIDSVAAKFKMNNGKTADAAPESDEHCPATEATLAAAAAAQSPAVPCTTTATTAANDEMKSTQATIAEEKLCKICYADEYNTAFLPCGHVVACAKCASSVSKCPVCRKPFTNVMRVFFP